MKILKQDDLYVEHKMDVGAGVGGRYERGGKHSWWWNPRIHPYARNLDDDGLYGFHRWNLWTRIFCSRKVQL